MKTALTMIAAMMLLACQQEKSKATQDAEVIYEMSQQNTQYVASYGAEDARAKMILKYGNEKMAWFDSATAAISAEYDQKDSIEQAKVDSVKAANQ